MVNELSDTIDCLYDTYLSQTKQLFGYGFSREDSFWIHFTSVSFMPWSETSHNHVSLVHILRFYAQIYRDEIISGNQRTSKTFIRCLLTSRFYLAYSLALKLKRNKPISEYVLDIGKCTLPHINDTAKHAIAGMFVISALPLSQRFNPCVSLGKLILDIKDYDTNLHLNNIKQVSA